MQTSIIPSRTTETRTASLTLRLAACALAEHAAWAARHAPAADQRHARAAIRHGRMIEIIDADMTSWLGRDWSWSSLVPSDDMDIGDLESTLLAAIDYLDGTNARCRRLAAPGRISSLGALASDLAREIMAGMTVCRAGIGVEN